LLVAADRVRKDGDVTTIDTWLRQILRCPSCQGQLKDGTGPDGSAELQCLGCTLAYPIDQAGFPVLLIGEARDRG
jgi:uncharacterized protein YbaR (Trm112 family)